mmetsp:Transcript_9645/g.24029  ORF Transcript_9645/g.24029 Transcript_9645/m.24029 type:complete len:167 (+) Transcript_9645:83-583(+)
MSGRSPSRSHDDDVESYRQRSRQNDRRYREDDSDYNRQNNKEEEKKKQLALERKERMARLRDQLKKEDETLAKLDQQQQSVENAQDEISPQEAIIEVKPEELEGLDEEEQMRKLLGFNGFGSTKGEAVEDNQSTAARGGAAKNKARKYRQYMNRKSGFNRPLEKMK